MKRCPFCWTKHKKDEFCYYPLTETEIVKEEFDKIIPSINKLFECDDRLFKELLSRN